MECRRFAPPSFSQHSPHTHWRYFCTAVHPPMHLRTRGQKGQKSHDSQTHAAPPKKIPARSILRGVASFLLNFCYCTAPVPKDTKVCNRPPGLASKILKPPTLGPTFPPHMEVCNSQAGQALPAQARTYPYRTVSGSPLNTWRTPFQTSNSWLLQPLCRFEVCTCLVWGLGFRV